MKKKIKRTPPAYIEPMQCKPVVALPDGAGWLFEIKFDGYRCIAIKDGSRVDLLSRNGKSLSKRFPDVVRALGTLVEDFVIDGEIVALDEQGRPAFQILQNSRSSEVPIQFYAFDLLNLAGKLLLDLSLDERREALDLLLSDAPPPVRLSSILPGTPSKILTAVRQLALEGIVGKRLDSVYQPGERSGQWIKYRTNREQEFVIGGYVPGRLPTSSHSAQSGTVSREGVVTACRTLTEPTITKDWSEKLAPAP